MRRSLSCSSRVVIAVSLAVLAISHQPDDFVLFLFFQEKYFFNRGILLCATLIITRLLRVCVDGGTWSSISSSDDDIVGT
jgi:hypothetical protein